MFTFRTNNDSSHTHYINGIGLHDIYVEFAWVHATYLVAAWMASAIGNAFADADKLPAKLPKSRLRDIVRDHFATYGTSVPPVDDAKHADIVEWANGMADNHHMALARVWMKRSHAVMALAYHLSQLSADAAKPRTVESLHGILAYSARNYGVNPPAVPETFQRVADDILFDCLPFYGGKQFDESDDASDDNADTLPLIAAAPESTTLVETVSTVETALVESPAVESPVESTADAEFAAFAETDITLVESTVETTDATPVESTTVESTPAKRKRRK